MKREKLLFKIITRYKNLRYFIKNQNLNQRQERWAFYLSRFNFEIKYILETSREKAENIIRLPGLQKEVENDNKKQILLKSE